ncbi:hypothetical protein CLAIMM_11244 isoform 2 [Cladophialophora immunda]|nr:hypothetical protein CLAIMM_11244 isoform 1 [Cladophialophora immunda]OQV06708.1 hypothetical protein CLAIMM_11244 isoform 2 [Cladophialophora immunda]
MRHAIVVGTCLDIELLRGRRYGLAMLGSTNELIREIRRLLSGLRSTPYLNPSEGKNESRFEGGSGGVANGNGGMYVDVDDDLLFAVMHLAKATGIRNISRFSDPLKTPSVRLRVLFKPPIFLRRLQYLHLWGLSDTPSPSSEASLHLSKLEMLVVLKGGLQRVKAPGFAEALHLFDIIESAKRLERPRFELPPSSIEFLERKMPTLRMAAALTIQHARVGGEIHQHLSLNSALGEIFEDIQILCSWISTLVRLSPANFQGGHRDSSSGHMASSEDVMVLRNLIEYRLLAHSPDPNNFVENLMWTSAMIFTHGVIFPLPHPEPMKVLVRRLCDTLRGEGNHLGGPSQPRSFHLPYLTLDNRILVWAATMGIMATSGSQAKERAFFLESLGRYLGGSDVSTWTQLKSILQAYLWADWACDAGGCAIWEMLSVTTSTAAHGQ